MCKLCAVLCLYRPVLYCAVLKYVIMIADMGKKNKKKLSYPVLYYDSRIYRMVLTVKYVCIHSSLLATVFL